MILDDIPGYQRARQRGARLEHAWREFAFVGARDRICGVPVRLLTLRAFLQLDAAGNPYIAGGRNPTCADVGVFLFRLSEEYENARAKNHSLGKARARFVQKIKDVSFSAADRQIRRFIARMLIDRPPARLAKNAAQRSYADVSFAADWIHAIASTYGWSMDEILDLPLPAAFQFLRKIDRAAHNAAAKKLPLFNPMQSRLTKRFRDRAFANP